MKRIRTENGVEKYNETTHEPVNIENDIIIGTGTTLIAKSDAKWICWDKFDKPINLIDYLNNAINTSYDDLMANYHIGYMDGETETLLYINESSKDFTTTDTDIEASFDVKDEDQLQSNMQLDVAKFDNIEGLVDCGSVIMVDGSTEVQKQDILDYGIEHLKIVQSQRNQAIDMNLTDEDIGTRIGLLTMDLTRDNFDSIQSIVRLGA